MNLEMDFDTVDISKDSNLRDAVKRFSSWPVSPLRNLPVLATFRVVSESLLVMTDLSAAVC
jgi:glutaredoxin-related protein